MLLKPSVFAGVGFDEQRLGFGPGIRQESNFRVDNTLSGYESDPYYKFDPLAHMNWKSFEINDKGLFFNFYRTVAWQVYLLTNFAGENYQSTGLTERQEAIFAGAGFRFYPLSVFYMHDMEGQSEGSFLRALLQIPYTVGPFTLLLTLGYSDFNELVTDYYYGVSNAEEADSSFAAYETSGSSESIYNLRLIYYIQKKWALYGMSEVRQFSNEITDSPTVKDDSQNIFVVGFWYDFL